MSLTLWSRRSRRGAAELVLEQLQSERADGSAAKYLNVEQAAAYIAGSKQRVYDLLSAGRLTRFKDGARVLVSRDEVDAYLAGARVGRVAHALPMGREAAWLLGCAGELGTRNPPVRARRVSGTVRSHAAAVPHAWGRDRRGSAQWLDDRRAAGLTFCPPWVNIPALY